MTVPGLQFRVVLQFNRVTIPPEPVDIEEMRITLIVVSEEVIETDLVRVPRAVPAGEFLRLPARRRRRAR